MAAPTRWPWSSAPAYEATVDIAARRRFQRPERATLMLYPDELLIVREQPRNFAMRQGRLDLHVAATGGDQLHLSASDGQQLTIRAAAEVRDAVLAWTEEDEQP